MFVVLPGTGAIVKRDPNPGRFEDVSVCAFFKWLVVVNPPVTLNRKAHMDQVFDQAKVVISPTLKVWEPQRQYEKRLNNIMNKDKGKSISTAVLSAELILIELQSLRADDERPIKERSVAVNSQVREKNRKPTE